MSCNLIDSGELCPSYLNSHGRGESYDSQINGSCDNFPFCEKLGDHVGAGRTFPSGGHLNSSHTNNHQVYYDIDCVQGLSHSWERHISEDCCSGSPEEYCSADYYYWGSSLSHGCQNLANARSSCSPQEYYNLEYSQGSGYSQSRSENCWVGHGEYRSSDENQGSHYPPLDYPSPANAQDSNFPPHFGNDHVKAQVAGDLIRDNGHHFSEFQKGKNLESSTAL